MAISFASDIKPLFRQIDIDHMKRHGVPLDDFAYMSDPANNHSNADVVFQTVVGNPPSMSPGGYTGRPTRSLSTENGWPTATSLESQRYGEICLLDNTGKIALLRHKVYMSSIPK